MARVTYLKPTGCQCLCHDAWGDANIDGGCERCSGIHEENERDATMTDNLIKEAVEAAKALLVDQGFRVIGTCGECKHWREPNNKMGMCLKTIDGWQAGVGTMAEDEWEGGIYCGPDFGCLHWKAKE